MLLSVLLPVNDFQEETHVQFIHDFKSIEDLKEVSYCDKKHEAHRISPYIMKKGITRFITENTLAVSGLMFDVDDGLSLKKCIKLIEKLSIKAMIYTTISHTEEVNKYRLLIPFEKPIKFEDFRSLKFSMKESSFWKTINPESNTMSLHPCDLPSPKSEFFEFDGKFFPTKKYIKEGRKIRDEIFYASIEMKMQENPKFEGYHDNYFKAIVNNNMVSFATGNRDNSIVKTIFALKNKDCDVELIHELMDLYINQMSLSEQRKYNKMIEGIKY